MKPQPALPEPASEPASEAATEATLLRRLRASLALLCLLGAALVMLPLTLALRSQASDADALASERSRLDPLVAAVALQRALLEHRDRSAAALQSSPARDAQQATAAAIEARRRQAQALVDMRLGRLQAVLVEGRWDAALAEAESLEQDWHALALAVALRRIDAAASAEGHQLLIETGVGLADLLTATVGDTAEAAAAPRPRTRQAPAALLGGTTLLTLLTAAVALGLQRRLLDLQRRAESRQAARDAARAAPNPAADAAPHSHGLQTQALLQRLRQPADAAAASGERPVK